MNAMTLRLTLRSAATFGRGDGVAGKLDREIEHDHDGFPYLRGKTLKGLLAEAAENVAYALAEQGKPDWQQAKHALFGQPGRGEHERGILHVGDAQLPESLREAILFERTKSSREFSPENVLYSLTGIRRQTAMNPEGAPEFGSLRAMRVLLPGVVLESQLSFDRDPSDVQKALLLAATLDFRRGGTGRNRGRGRLLAELENETTTQQLFQQFADMVKA